MAYTLAGVHSADTMQERVTAVTNGGQTQQVRETSGCVVDLAGCGVNFIPIRSYPHPLRTLAEKRFCCIAIATNIKTAHRYSRSRTFFVLTPSQTIHWLCQTHEMITLTQETVRQLCARARTHIYIYIYTHARTHTHKHAIKTTKKQRKQENMQTYQQTKKKPVSFYFFKRQTSHTHKKKKTVYFLDI